MDDFLVAATTHNLIDDFHNTLSKKYNVKRLGRPKSYLNWHFSFTDKGRHVSQPAYITEIAERLKMSNANTKKYPFISGINLDLPADAEPEIKTSELYREVVGDLRYLSDCTRFDIAYIAVALARALSKPTERHWQHLKRSIRYLLHTPTHGILYPYDKPIHLTSFADADYARCGVARKSVSGYVRLVGGSPVHWRSKRQDTVALSTC